MEGAARFFCLLPSLALSQLAAIHILSPHACAPMRVRVCALQVVSQVTFKLVPKEPSGDMSDAYVEDWELQV